jgi:glycerate-2-kinase
MIKNYEALLFESFSKKNRDLRQFTLDIISEGIKAANPQEAINRVIKLEGDTLIIDNTWVKKLDPSMKIIVIGAGKASAQMALAIENLLGKKISNGQINIPAKSVTDLPKPEIIKLHFAGHPIVSKESINGTKKIISLIKNLNENDLIICLISGGGSALLELPFDTISLNDLENVFTLLTRKGATIHELNTIRKHLSQVKGGKLAQIAYPAQIISLIISDVIGDKLDTIASGPTAPDKTSIQDVRKIIRKYKIKNLLPTSVKNIFYLKDNQQIETLKETNPIFQKVSNFIIASNEISCLKMKEYANSLGFNGKIYSTNICGEARNIGQKIAEEIMRHNEKIVLIAGGETTVTIKGSGLGGRNQELALAASIILKNQNNIVLASIGSDGIDGPTDAAGAIIDGHTIKKGLDISLNQFEYLKNNDSYNYLKKTGNLIYTGLTGTNVGDFIIAIKDI